jgi:hypothetical protein
MDIASRHNHCYCLNIAFAIFLHYKERQDIVCRTLLLSNPTEARTPYRRTPDVLSRSKSSISDPVQVVRRTDES